MLANPIAVVMGFGGMILLLSALVAIFAIGISYDASIPEPRNKVTPSVTPFPTYP